MSVSYVLQESAGSWLLGVESNNHESLIRVGNLLYNCNITDDEPQYLRPNFFYVRTNAKKLLDGLCTKALFALQRDSREYRGQKRKSKMAECARNKAQEQFDSIPRAKFLSRKSYRKETPVVTYAYVNLDIDTEDRFVKIHAPLYEMGVEDETLFNT